MEITEEQKDYLARAMVLGIIIGLMIAPQSGEATRNQLRYKIEKMRGKLQEKIAGISMMDKEDYEEKIDEFIETAQEKEDLTIDEARDLKDGLMSLYDKVQEEWT